MTQAFERFSRHIGEEKSEDHKRMIWQSLSEDERQVYAYVQVNSLKELLDSYDQLC